MEHMLYPTDTGYDRERSSFQRAWQHRPRAVAAVTSAHDVRVAVEYARSHELAVAVQATGHGSAMPVGDDGVLISTRGLTGVRLDPKARTAWVEAGARWQQVIDAAAAHGLAPLSGSAPHVGAVSYTLGGGLGLLARTYGYAADHVRAIEVVTADGQLRRCDPGTEPDLFWALRGGRDNFGVVTGLEIELMPVAEIFGGALVFAGERASELVRAYLDWARDLPDELTSSLAFVTAPNLDVAAVRIAYVGDPVDGERLVEPLRAVGPLGDELRQLPYVESDSIYRDSDRPIGFYGVHNAMVRDIDADTLTGVLDHGRPATEVPFVLEVRHLGGALGRAPRVPNAVGHRDAQYLVRVMSPLPNGEPVAVARAVHDKAFAAVEPRSLGRFLSFAYGALTAEEVRSGYEARDYTRLIELKRRYDPANLFRFGHNIPPASVDSGGGARGGSGAG